MPVQAYLDTTALKFAANAIAGFAPRPVTITWGGKRFDTVVHDPVVISPNDSLENERLKVEANLLPEVAELGKVGAITFGIQAETEIESWGLSRMNSETGRFFGAKVERLRAPIEYGREVIGAGIDCVTEQYDFLTSIRDKRYLQIQRMTGAYQGKNPVNRNQLLDAWHLWCAEASDCEYFLTLDFKLEKVLGRSSGALNTTVIFPSGLIETLRGGT